MDSRSLPGIALVVTAIGLVLLVFGMWENEGHIDIVLAIGMLLGVVGVGLLVIAVSKSEDPEAS